MTSFIDFARAHGLVIDPGKFHPSPRIRRCGTVDKPRSDNGAYFWDGERGWIHDWSGEARTIWWNDPHATPWTDAEKRAWVAKRASVTENQARLYERAAQRADIILRSARLDHHPYLEYKGFPDEKGLVMEDRLLIPMRNVKTNDLQGYQSIYWDAEARRYEKKMLPGMRARDAVLTMGIRGREAWLVEGYATGLSVRAALRSCGLSGSVVVCFSASNMVRVADQLPGHRFVFADNDESKTGEEAALETGLPWTMADGVGEDANDLHRKSGLFAVVRKIMDCRNQAMRHFGEMA